MYITPMSPTTLETKQQMECAIPALLVTWDANTHDAAGYVILMFMCMAQVIFFQLG